MRPPEFSQNRPAGEIKDPVILDKETQETLNHIRTVLGLHRFKSLRSMIIQDLAAATGRNPNVILTALSLVLPEQKLDYDSSVDPKILLESIESKILPTKKSYETRQFRESKMVAITGILEANRGERFSVAKLEKALKFKMESRTLNRILRALYIEGRIKRATNTASHQTGKIEFYEYWME